MMKKRTPEELAEVERRAQKDFIISADDKETAELLVTMDRTMNSLFAELKELQAKQKTLLAEFFTPAESFTLETHAQILRKGNYSYRWYEVPLNGVWLCAPGKYRIRIK